MMKEKNIQELAKRMGLVTVEDMCQYTIAQLVVKIANKVNELVNEVWRFETDVQEVLKTQNENIQYLLGEGLHLEVGNIFDEWVQDGTFDTLINQSALKKVNERIDETNAQLSEVDNNVELRRTTSVNVKSFGAKGDGVTDDTNAIKLALESSNVIYFPKGTYRVTETINLTKSTKIFGDENVRNWGAEASTTLKKESDGYIFSCSWGNINNFENINFDGNGIYQPCSAIIRGCSFTGGIGIEKARTTVVESCVFSGCSIAGIKTMVDSRIINNFFMNCGIGIYMYNSNDNIIESNKIEWNETGIKLEINVFNSIQNNIFDRNSRYGIESVDGASVRISNNQFERNLLGHIFVRFSNGSIVGNSFYSKQYNDDGTGDHVPSESIILDSSGSNIITSNFVNTPKMFSSSYSNVTNTYFADNLINGKSEYFDVNFGEATVGAKQKKQFRVQWSEISGFFGANGYDVIIDNIRVEEGLNTHYCNPNYKVWFHKNNGIYFEVTNDSDSNITITPYVTLKHTRFSKR